MADYINENCVKELNNKKLIIDNKNTKVKKVSKCLNKKYKTIFKMGRW